VHADLFDKHAEEFLGLFGISGGDDLIESVGDAGEGGRVRRRVGLCGELICEVGFVAAERFEPAAEAADAVLAERG
jgi:hypothetical protein